MEYIRIERQQGASAQTTLECVIDNFLKNDNSDKDSFIDILKSVSKELDFKYYNRNIKIEIDVNFKLNDCKLKITEYNL